MTKPKPIVIVKIGLLSNTEENKKLTDMLEDRFEGYHVLVCFVGNLPEPEFQVFYEKDFNHVKFEELKQIVKDNYKK